MKVFKILSSVFSWASGALGIFLVWLEMEFRIGQYLDSFSRIIIPIILTIVKVAILIAREVAVATEEHCTTLGVLTLIFVSLPGGIFTILFGTVRPRYGTRQNVYITNRKTTSWNTTNEFIVISPDENNYVRVGSTVTVERTYFDENICKRIVFGDYGQVTALNDMEATIRFEKDNKVFMSTIPLCYLKIKIKNPFYKKQ